MRTRRSPRNQERLWRLLGARQRPAPIPRTPLCSRADARRRMVAAAAPAPAAVPPFDAETEALLDAAAEAAAARPRCDRDE